MKQNGIESVTMLNDETDQSSYEPAMLATKHDLAMRANANLSVPWLMICAAYFNQCMSQSAIPFTLLPLLFIVRVIKGMSNSLE